MVDYEGIKAMIEARKKQWQNQAERAKSLQAEMPMRDALDPLITALDASVAACEVILQDMATAHDIYQSQLQEKARGV